MAGGSTSRRAASRICCRCARCSRSDLALLLYHPFYRIRAEARALRARSSSWHSTTNRTTLVNSLARAAPGGLALRSDVYAMFSANFSHYPSEDNAKTWNGSRLSPRPPCNSVRPCLNVSPSFHHSNHHDPSYPLESKPHLSGPHISRSSSPDILQGVAGNKKPQPSETEPRFFWPSVVI
jgi:hypothetical protein